MVAVARPLESRSLVVTLPIASVVWAVRPRPYQSGRIWVRLPLGSVEFEADSASKMAGAGLPEVPLLVQPCSW